MSSHDRKSASLFKKLLKQNMMTSDSFIKASEAQIIQFNKFLIQEAELQTAALYKRKEMLDEVMSLLHEDSLNQRQVKRVIILLHRLNMKVTANSTIEGLHPNAVKQHTSGKIKKVDTEKPQDFKSWTLLKKAEEKRLESLKHDWKELNNWLMEISGPTSKVNESRGSHSKKSEKKHLPNFTLINTNHNLEIIQLRL
ncbi:hypothetical protein JTE90_027609 [Oedothorax gibbosus]|uniref:Uncharacterized protein n=1 Tax=Oedothorax gibbosus TaxID=931172 RepID=A0AAV6VL34_9ARAC|nr:hypothetical protein JTE90_027609 [Oedothorax gibbosus]